MNFIAALVNYYPNIDASLNKRKFHEFSGSLQKYQASLPESFFDLYRKYDGENDRSPGIFAGLSWMSNADIDAAQKILSDSTAEKYSHLPNQIQQGTYADYWIPFAHDHSGSYLAIDVNPGVNGNKGQVISLDRNSDEVYVLAKNVDDFCQFVLESIANEKIIMEQEDDALMFFWKSGHLFNDMNSLRPSTSVGSIELTGYWREYFKNKTKDGWIAISELEKISQIVINDRNVSYNGPINFDILRYCINLTELICHSDSVISFAHVNSLKKLKKFYVKSIAFTNDSLKYLSACSSLKDLGLIATNLNSLDCLSSLSIKTLAMINSQIQHPESILAFKDLSELRIEGVLANNYAFLSDLKKLNVLDIKNIPINDFDFLKSIKLTEFKVNDLQVSNKYDDLVASISTLKDTDWPFADLSLLSGNSKLNSIGVNAANLSHIEALKETNIRSVRVVNASSKQHAQSVIDHISQYKQLVSYEWENTWKNNS